MKESNVEDPLLQNNENNILEEQKKKIESLKNIEKSKVNERKLNNLKEKEEIINKKIDFRNEVIFAITFLGRIIMTLYSFHGLFFIYNFIIQYIILVPGILYEINIGFFQVLFGLIYVIFAISTSNVLVIPTYEFFLFPFLTFKNPLYHFK